MSTDEAMTYVDLIIERLHDEGVIPEYQYGHMTEDLRQELAESVARKSEE